MSLFAEDTRPPPESVRKRLQTSRDLFVKCSKKSEVTGFENSALLMELSQTSTAASSNMSAVSC